jgi:hypothetical protein
MFLGSHIKIEKVTKILLCNYFYLFLSVQFFKKEIVEEDPTIYIGKIPPARI